ncbi:MAG: 5-formyltetrahydrofolate cyclo-ligase [Verrucomicrobiales bacterium]|nr:5-formyltetrahydrofolate cyclo-ligase [Verrucomicrobiales bacterium]
MIPEEKAELRRRIQGRIRAVDPERRVEASRAMMGRILKLPAWIDSRCVLLYAPLKDEPDLRGLLAIALSEGRTVALPSFSPGTGIYGARRIGDPERDLVPGRFGVREPGPDCREVPLEALDFAVVPGLAFTQEGWRLGRGGGFYDRLLKSTPALRCGVGLDEQVLVRLPAEPHDVQLDFVVTPTATHWCRRAPQ